MKNIVSAVQHAGVLVALLLLAVLASPAAVAVESVGMVVIAAGEVEAISAQGEQRSLKRRSPLYQGDRVLTGEQARAQLRFVDGAIVALKPDSELRIDAYQYHSGAEEEDQGVLTLLKGGFRTVTGAIGERSPEDYRVSTDIATIGIRGTDYELLLGDGLAIGVWQGGVRVRNDQGTLDLGAGADYRFGFVSGSGEPPRGQLRPPAGIGSAAVPLSAARGGGIRNGRYSVGDDVPPPQRVADGDVGPSLGSSPAAPPVGAENSDMYAALPEEARAAVVSGQQPAPPQNSTALPITDQERNSLNYVGAMLIASGASYGLIDQAGDEPRWFVGGLASRGSDGSPIFADKGMAPGTAGFDAEPLLYLARRGDAPLENFLAPAEVAAEGGPPAVYYGEWDGAEMPLYVVRNPADPTDAIQVDARVHWMTVLPMNHWPSANGGGDVDLLQGTAQYQGLPGSSFSRGSSSDGEVVAVTIAFDVAYSTTVADAISNGSIMLRTAGGTQWTAAFTGELDDDFLSFEVRSVVYESQVLEADAFQLDGFLAGSGGRSAIGFFSGRSGAGDWINGIFSAATAGRPLSADADARLSLSEAPVLQMPATGDQVALMVFRGPIDGDLGLTSDYSQSQDVAVLQGRAFVTDADDVGFYDWRTDPYGTVLRIGQAGLWHAGGVGGTTADNFPSRIAWGYWDTTAGPVRAQRDPTAATASEDIANRMFWVRGDLAGADAIEARAASGASAVQYDTNWYGGVVGSMTDSSGATSSISEANSHINLTIDFVTGAISNGSLSIGNGSNQWLVGFEGRLGGNGELHFRNTSMSYTESGMDQGVVRGELRGFLSGSDAARVLGGFKYEAGAAHTEGVFMALDRSTPM